MQSIYVVSYYKVDNKLNDELIRAERYADDQQAMDSAKEWILEQTKNMDVMSYLSAIRTGKYHKGYTSTEYRKMVSDYFIEFFSCEKAVQPTCSRDFEWGPEDYDDCNGTHVCRDNFSDFEASVDVGCTVLECNFGNHLKFDSTFMTSPYADDGSYCLIKDDNGGFKFDMWIDWKPLFYSDGSNKSLNIFAVYYILHNADEPFTQEELQSKFKDYTDGYMSEKTIGKHLDTLKALGFPITYVHKDEIWNEKSGYCLDKCSLNDIPDVDASTLGASAYVMLVLMTLDRSEKEMSPREIMDYIKEHFNVNISKTAVLRHLKKLIAIREIEPTANGGYYRK